MKRNSPLLAAMMGLAAMGAASTISVGAQRRKASDLPPHVPKERAKSSAYLIGASSDKVEQPATKTRQQRRREARQAAKKNVA